MTKKDLVERELLPTTVRFSQAWRGHKNHPIPFNYPRAILESLEVLTIGVDEILRYIQEKEKERKLEL